MPTAVGDMGASSRTIDPNPYHRGDLPDTVRQGLHTNGRVRKSRLPRQSGGQATLFKLIAEPRRLLELSAGTLMRSRTHA